MSNNIIQKKTDISESSLRLSWWTMIFYGLGREVTGLTQAAFGGFLLFYYQQVVGISGTLTGIALAIALCCDAITDPIIGALSDRTHSRWGRRHPFMLMSVLPLLVSFYFLFNPPDGLSDSAAFVWLTFFAVTVRLSLTLFDIPHLALGAELVGDYVQRTTLFTLANFFRYCAIGTVFVLGFGVFFPTTTQYNPGPLNPDRYGPFSLFLMSLMVVFFLITILGTSKQIPYLKSAANHTNKYWYAAYTDVRQAFSNQSFPPLFLGVFATTLIAALEGALLPFMGFHFWGFTSEQVALVFFIGPALAAPISVWLIPKLTQYYDKKTIVIGCFLGVILVSNWATILRLTGVGWFPDNSSLWIVFIIGFNAFFMVLMKPAISSSVDSMMADVADEIDLETGERREGILYSALTFIGKATAAIGLIIGGALLDFIEFPENAEAGSVAADIIWELGFLQGPVASVLILCGVFFFFAYPLTRTRHQQIVTALQQRDADK